MTELIREYWDWFLLDTLLWTGVLIGIALMLRRPVSKYLGAGAAYALWFLPLARLLFPPVTLPAWMQFSLFASEPAAEPVLAEPMPLEASETAFSYADIVAPVAPTTFESPIDLVTPLVILWLLGAAIFMGRRFWLYGQLRKELLEDAKPVGEVDNIRLIETTAISGPMAFGVFDKVIALPDGFMISRERQVRDLAIAHELAHHRGHDILVNVLIQPLFAVHWFNPLGWMGWTAMRRDQEAACDARVVASRSRDERAAYAAIIADFARRPQIAPRPALAAPMACPVLGDKSIIHRLRSLPMSDDSRRRRFAARGAVAAAVLALPMTASICYVGAAPAQASALPVVAPEMTEVVAPIPAPGELAKPIAPELVFLDEDGLIEVALERRELADKRREQADERRERAEEQRERAWEAERERQWERARTSYAQGRQQWAAGRVEYARGRQQWADGRLQWAESRVEHSKEKAKRKEAMALASAGWGEEMGEAIAHSVSTAVSHVPEVINDCRYPETPVKVVEKDSGKITMFVCESAGDRIALKALISARAEMAADDEMPANFREEILRDLDREIKKLKKELRSAA